MGDNAGRRRTDRPRRFRRGVFLLPSLFTVANLFCGYACVVYSTRADFDTAALFVGIAIVLLPYARIRGGSGALAAASATAGSSVEGSGLPPRRRVKSVSASYGAARTP